MLMLHSIEGFLICLIRKISVIRGSVCLLPGYGFYLSQKISKFALVDLHAVVQVEADPLVSVVTQLFVKTHCPGGLPSVLQLSV